MAGQSSNLNVTVHLTGTTADPIVLLHCVSSNAMAVASFPMAAGVNGAVLGAVNRAAAAAALPQPATTGIDGHATTHFLLVPVVLQVIGHGTMTVVLLVFSFVLPPHVNDDDIHQVAAEPEQHGGMLLVDTSNAAEMDQLLDELLEEEGGEVHQVDDVDVAGGEAPEGRPWYMEEEDMSSTFDDFDIGGEI